MQIKSRIAERHMPGFALSGLDNIDRDRSVLVRFDGRTDALGEPCIYAVVSTDDMAKLPPDILRGMKMAGSDGEGAIFGSPHLFFVDKPDTGMCLYIDTEMHEGFMPAARTACDAAGIAFLPVKGDLKALENGEGHVAPPSAIAASTNGFRLAPVSRGIEDIHQKRDARAESLVAGPGEIPDGPGYQ